MEICGEYFKCGNDKDLYAYFRAHYRHFFPNLTDRTLFVRAKLPTCGKSKPLFNGA